MHNIRTFWARLTLRGRLTWLLICAVLAFDTASSAIRYHLLEERHADLARDAAIDFASSIVPLVLATPEAERPQIVARLFSPHRNAAMVAQPDPALTISRFAWSRLLAEGVDVSDARLAMEVLRSEDDMKRLASLGLTPVGATNNHPVTAVSLAVSAEGLDGWLLLRILINGPRPLEPLWRQMIYDLCTAFLLVALMAAIVTRLTDPLGRLASASHQISRGERVDPISLDGSADIRAMTTAFNKMSTSVAQTIAWQLSLIQSLGHDLKSPVSRLRQAVRAETQPPAQDRLMACVDQVHDTLAAITAFTRATMHDGDIAPVDLGSMLEALLEESLDRGGDADGDIEENVLVPARFDALMRAFRNLIENAVIHGGSVRVQLRRLGKEAEVLIDDCGPGIPAASMESVLEPFHRLSDDPRGSGLGLAIANTVILDHGGQLHLTNRDEGGLRVRVTLPL